MTDLAVQKRIQLARNEARLLYNEVKTARSYIMDTTLREVARPMARIPAYNSLQLYHTLRGHQDKVAQIKWSTDSGRIVLASQDGFVIMWDPVTGLKKNAIVLENPWVLTCLVLGSGRLVASGGLDNACTIYLVGNSEAFSHDSALAMYGSLHTVEAVLKAHTAYISDCEFLSEALVVTGSGDMSCCQWDLATGTKVRDFVDHLGDVLCLSKGTPQVFVSGSSDGYVKVWDVRQRAPTQNFFVSNSDVNCLRLTADDYGFVTGLDDGMVRMFDLRLDCEINRYSLQLQLHQQYEYADSPGRYSSSSLDLMYNAPGVILVDVSVSGRLLYACYSNYGCVVWDALKSEAVGSVGQNTHSNVINQVRVAPDGIGLCTASWDSTINVWAT